MDLKLNRAKDHFYALVEEVTKFQTDPDSYSLSFDHEAERGLGICRVAEVHSPPLAISIGIGECLHQYRSALDHLLFQLVIANSRGRLPAAVERRAEFPIFSSGTRFRGRVNRKGKPSSGSGRAKIQDIAPEAQAVIERLHRITAGRTPERAAFGSFRNSPTSTSTASCTSPIRPSRDRISSSRSRTSPGSRTSAFGQGR